jgi:hypothetical protein
MVLVVGDVYNLRVLMGLSKTSQKSISCVLFALFNADVYMRVIRKLLALCINCLFYYFNKHWCTRSSNTLPPLNCVQFPPGSNWVAIVGL